MNLKEETIDRMRREALGARLRARRLLKGWSAARLAREAQVPAESLCRIEKGRRWVTLPTLIKIADAYGISVSDLL